MASKENSFSEILPKVGQLYQEDLPSSVLCKPKLMPLKSVTLEKLEKMQKEAQETVKQQDKEERLEQQAMFAGPPSGGDGDRLTL